MLLTSNNNQTQGKVYGKRNEYDFSERSGCAGYALLLGLIAVAVVLFAVVIPALMK